MLRWHIAFPCTYIWVTKSIQGQTKRFNAYVFLFHFYFVTSSNFLISNKIKKLRVNHSPGQMQKHGRTSRTSVDYSCRIAAIVLWYSIRFLWANNVKREKRPGEFYLNVISTFRTCVRSLVASSFDVNEQSTRNASYITLYPWAMYDPFKSSPRPTTSMYNLSFGGDRNQRRLPLWSNVHFKSIRFYHWHVKYMLTSHWYWPWQIYREKIYHCMAHVNPPWYWPCQIIFTVRNWKKPNGTSNRLLLVSQ